MAERPNHTPLGNAEIRPAFNGLDEITRRFTVAGEAARAATADTDCFRAYGVADDEWTTALLVRKNLVNASGDPNSTDKVLIEVYQEFTAGQKVNVGEDRIVIGEDGRKMLYSQFVALASEAEGLAGTPGDAGPMGYVHSGATVNKNGVGALITVAFLQATSTPAQIGDVVMGDIDGAFIGTHVTTFEYVDGVTAPARSFTYRYVVAGDGTIVAANWLASNATLAATGDLPARYFISSEIVRKGIGYTIISRLYYEKPATFSFPRSDNYPFEGKIGPSGNLVVVTQDPQTRTTTLEIRESYHIGPVAPDAREWEPLSWASGTLAYRPALNNPSGDDGYFPFNFSNCIGTVTVAQTNGYFQGIKVTNVTGTVESNPTTYPTGKKLIRSIPARWAGQMWRKTNYYVTYP